MTFQVGKALGVSILDLTGSNPCSRIPHSEFHTLSGIRDWIRINCVPEQNYVHKVLPSHRQARRPPCTVQVGHFIFYPLDDTVGDSNIVGDKLLKES